MNSSTRETDEPLPVLQLTDWPLRDDATQVVVASIGISGFAALIGLWSGKPWLAAAAAGVLFLAAWRLWLPVRFELDVRGVQWSLFRLRRFIPWDNIADAREDEQGVLLLGNRWPWPWSALRGLYIAGHGRRDELLAVVRFYIRRDRPDDELTETQVTR